MEHPLAMDAETMRRAGYATVDALVARLADPGADPVLRRAGAAAMRARLGGPPPEQPGDYTAVLARVMTDVLPYAARPLECRPVLLHRPGRPLRRLHRRPAHPHPRPR